MPSLLRKLYRAKVGISLSLKDVGFLFPLGPYGNVSEDSLQNNSNCLDMCHYNETLFSLSGCNLLVIKSNLVICIIQIACTYVRPKYSIVGYFEELEKKMGVNIHYNPEGRKSF